MVGKEERPPGQTQQVMAQGPRLASHLPRWAGKTHTTMLSSNLTRCCRNETRGHILLTNTRIHNTMLLYASVFKYRATTEANLTHENSECVRPVEQDISFPCWKGPILHQGAVRRGVSLGAPGLCAANDAGRLPRGLRFPSRLLHGSSYAPGAGPRGEQGQETLPTGQDCASHCPSAPRSLPAPCMQVWARWVAVAPTGPVPSWVSGRGQGQHLPTAPRLLQPLPALTSFQGSSSVY